MNEVEKPTPKDKEVLVRVQAASINYGNLVLLKGEPKLARLAFGICKPKYVIPGGDISGKVEAVGENVRMFEIGDEVFGDLSSCGWGGFAEYVAVPESALASKPKNISFEEAAAVPMAAVTALQAIRNKGKLQPGQRVLINGASGGVGTFAVQIAKALGAEVTGVVSTKHVPITQTIGADYVIDYIKEDFSKNPERYDLIIAANGNHPISVYKRLLNPTGTFVAVGGSYNQTFQALLLGPLYSMWSKQKMNSFLQRANQQDLIFIQQLIEEGKVHPIIDRIYSIDEIVEAFQYFEEGHSKGKVIITM
ncbi:NAD(P)-dependent alcohol dehydrogenase [Sporosarcina sp. 179-K 3D1 HS]|uniref:NAD(P)-dependent alcohol dehydrogenase n=1 Tax=Sporosarcina sp. 179-K 3D1 HS TaxID=3232169 RepID=UPI0039A22F63